MSELLPTLRRDIDVMPSPVEEQPGLVLRDPFGYSEHVLIVPPAWVVVLQCLDGTHTARDAQAILTRLAGGELVTSDEIGEFVAVLSEAGFIEGDALDERRDRRQAEFRNAPRRQPSHAGSAYPADPSALREEFSKHLTPGHAAAPEWPLAIAAPHISPEGGFSSYAAAYDLPASPEPLTCIILGTSHYGAPERFGTTAKPFETPLGTVEVDEDALRRVVADGGDAVVEEDYCHRAEHSIEFQVVFLQYRLRTPFRIVPILCGPFADSLTNGRPPEALDGNRRVFDALAGLQSQRDDLVWVLGVDMAHIGTRYGHEDRVRAGEGVMQDVGEEDRRRLERICAGDAEGYYELTRPGGDELNWCGYAPIYTFLKSVGETVELTGRVRSYEQWNIDESSVVTFGALHFDAPSKR